MTVVAEERSSTSLAPAGAASSARAAVRLEAIVNVVAVIVIILSAIPVYLAQRLAGPESGNTPAAP